MAKIKLIVLASLIYCGTLTNAFAQKITKNYHLHLGETLKAYLSKNETHIFTIKLNKGETAILRTNEGGVDGINIKVKWDSLFVVRDDIDKWGEQTILVVNTRGPNTRQISVSQDGDGQAPGKYSIRFLKVRSAVRSDVLDNGINVLYGMFIETEKYDNPDSVKKVYTNLYDLVSGLSDSLIKANVSRFVGRSFIKGHLQDYARIYLTQALKLYESLGGKYEVAECLHYIGDSYYRQGDKEQEIGYEARAGEIFKTMGDKLSAAESYNNIGLSYAILGDTINERIYYNQALQILPDRKSELAGTIYNNIGFQFTQHFKSDSAIFYYKKALPLRQSKYSQAGKAQTLSNLAVEYANIKKYDLAIKSITEAMKIADAAKDTDNSILYRANLGADYYYFFHDKIKARGILEKALVMRNEVSSSTDEVHHQLSHIEMDDKNWKKALYHINFLTKLRDTLWNINLVNVSAKKYGESRLEPYYHKVRCLMELSKEEKDKRYADSACDVASDIKGRSFILEYNLAKTNNNKLTHFRTLDSIASTISDTYLFQPASQNKIDIYTGLLEYYHYILSSNVSDKRPFNFDQTKAVQPDNSIIYLLDDIQSYAWVKTGNHRFYYTLPDRHFFDTTISKINAGIQLYYSFTGEKREMVRKLVLYEIGHLSAVLRPVFTKLRNDKILVCRDGALSLMPFQLLDIDTTGNAYLPAVTRYEFSYLPSFRFYEEALKDDNKRDMDSLLVIADPIFSYSEGRAHNKVKTDKKPQLEFERLVNSVGEAKKIARYFNKSMLLSESRASKNNFMTLSLTDYSYIHFATHSVYDLDITDLSNIVLSFADTTGKSYNPLLFAFEIQNLHLNAKLVVLGSCYSGFGKAYTTEGVLSLERAFMVAGASSVISANWFVPDQFSSDFFSQFYSYHRSDGYTISHALRQAQLDSWDTGGLASVLDWGAFTYTGIGR